MIIFIIYQSYMWSLLISKIRDSIFGMACLLLLNITLIILDPKYNNNNIIIILHNF